jgi:hypothetical protein
MALKGNLRDFSITQLLNLISLAKKSGALYIEGSDDIARIFFREGKLAYLQMGEREKSLLQLMVENKKITPAQYSLLSPRLAGFNDKEAGLFLMNGGYSNQSETFRMLEDHFSNLMRTLFNWSDGYFHFDAGELPPEDKIPTRLALENLIIEGARQLHEFEELKAEIPSLEMALKFTDRPGTNIRNINLSTEEWQVVSYVNPKNSIQQIAHTTKLDELEVRRVVYALLQAGLVEVIRPDGVPIPVKGKITPLVNRGEQKSLVNRLIERIRSI